MLKTIKSWIEAIHKAIIRRAVVRQFMKVGVPKEKANAIADDVIKAKFNYKNQ